MKQTQEALMAKKKDDFDIQYVQAVKEFYKNLGEELFLLRSEKNWSLEEAADKVSTFMAAHPIDWAPNGQAELMRLEQLIQMALFYGKKVKITFE
jgi:hypothetical protein